MAISLDSVKRSGALKPSINLWYAPPGMGKTTIAAGAPNPIFIQTEDGLGVLKVDTFGLLRTYEDVVAAMLSLAKGEHDYRTVVLDSAGWLEPLIWDKTCRVNNWANIEAAGYGKGPIAALQYWREILEGFNYLRNARGMGVEILAHAGVGKQELPDTENFDQYQPKLNRRATEMLQEYAENVFFINTRVSITRSNAADKNSRALGVGSDQRYVYTTIKPAHVAKNRFNMPAMIPLPSPAPGMPADPLTLFVTVAKHIPYYKELIDAKNQSAPALALPTAAVAVEAEALVEQANPFANLLGEATNTAIETSEEISETEIETATNTEAATAAGN